LEVTINCSLTCDTSKLESEFAKVQATIDRMVATIKEHDPPKGNRKERRKQTAQRRKTRRQA
jgi:hypothetical protein